MLDRFCGMVSAIPSTGDSSEAGGAAGATGCDIWHWPRIFVPSSYSKVVSNGIDPRSEYQHKPVLLRS